MSQANHWDIRFFTALVTNENNPSAHTWFPIKVFRILWWTHRSLFSLQL